MEPEHLMYLLGGLAIGFAGGYAFGQDWFWQPIFRGLDHVEGWARDRGLLPDRRRSHEPHYEHDRRVR